MGYTIIEKILKHNTGVSDIKAGDIVVYPGHVAIYMGDGKIVHAANSRLGICYGTATYRTIVSVRRVL